MNNKILACCALLMLFSCTSDKQKTVKNSDTDNQKLIEWVELKIDSVIQTNNIPAISMGIIKNGELILSEGYGVKDRNSNIKVDENSIYQIGSDTKKMTGIIVRNLVSEGKLNLDEFIITYLPNTLEDQSKETLKDIKLIDVLHHKSGIPNRAPGNKRIDGEPMLIAYTEQNLIDDLNNIKLDFEPGTKFGYSNFGYAVIGYICENVSGKKYADLINLYISKKYDMPNTAVVLSEIQLNQLVTPYRKDDRNTATKAFNMGKIAPAGGVYSTIADEAKLMTSQIEAYREYSQSGSLSNPLILTEISGTEGDDYGFGLGKKVFDTGTQFGHGGDLDGFASAYLFSPEYRSGVLILTSSGGRWVGEFEREIFYKLTDRKYTPSKESLALGIYNIVSKNGFQKAKEWFDEHRTSTRYYLKEEEMDEVGYAILESEKIIDAVAVFKLNAELFPESANVYSSLGEAYLNMGNEELAIKSYKKSLELNPQNVEVAELVNEMEQE